MKKTAGHVAPGLNALVVMLAVTLGGCASVNYETADNLTAWHSGDTATLHFRASSVFGNYFSPSGFGFVIVNGTVADFEQIPMRVAVHVQKVDLPVTLPAGENEYELLIGLGAEGSDSDWSGDCVLFSKVQLNLEAGKTYYLDIRFTEGFFGLWATWRLVLFEEKKRIGKFPAKRLPYSVWNNYSYPLPAEPEGSE